MTYVTTYSRGLASSIGLPERAEDARALTRPVMDGVMVLSAVEFAALFDGLDWTRVQALPRIPTPTAAA